MSLVSKPFRSLDVRGLHLRQDFQRSSQACVSHDDGAHVRLPEFSVPAKRGEREPVLCLHQGPTGSVPGAVEGGNREPQWLERDAGRMDTCAGGPEGTVLCTGRCEHVLSPLCSRHFEAVCDDFYMNWYHSKAALSILYIKWGPYTVYIRHVFCDLSGGSSTSKLFHKWLQAWVKYQ